MFPLIKYVHVWFSPLALMVQCCPTINSTCVSEVLWHNCQELIEALPGDGWKWWIYRYMNVRYKYAEHVISSPWARWSQCSGGVLKDGRTSKGIWIAEISVWWSQMFPAKLERQDLQSEPCRLTSQQEPFWQHLQTRAGGKRSKHMLPDTHILCVVSAWIEFVK